MLNRRHLLVQVSKDLVEEPADQGYRDGEQEGSHQLEDTRAQQRRHREEDEAKDEEGLVEDHQRHDLLGLLRVFTLQVVAHLVPVDQVVDCPDEQSGGADVERDGQGQVHGFLQRSADPSRGVADPSGNDAQT